MILKNSGTSKAAALDLANRGFAVFPCHKIDSTGQCSCGDQNCSSPGKHPATGNGFKDASREPAAIERLFRGSRSTANLAIATGPASGVWVLDVEAAGIEHLDKLQQKHGTLPKTVSSITGGDGRHYYFTYNGVEVKNQTKITIPGSGKVPIDVRGDGGYVVVPPSNHASGNSYQWENPPETTPIVEAPAWLLALVISGKPAEPVVSTPAPRLTFTVATPVDDLATAPGARGPTGDQPGERHDTAKRLIGSALGRGVDPCEVARQAVEWARRCSPPMDENEVLRLVGDLARKEGVKIEATAAEVEAAPLPEAVEWPILDLRAYHGLAGEIVEAIRPESEADPVAILAQLLVSVGNLIGRQPRFVVEGTDHHTNVNAVLVGRTARGRKGTSEGRVRQILQFVDERWSLENIKTGLVSGEGLIWHVRDPIYKTENIKEKGRIVGAEQVLADPGVEDKRLLVIESEFAAPLRVCRRETNTLSPTLRSAWDSGILRTLAKNSPATATNAHISVIGHITQEELRRALAEVDGFNGFANRFLWLAVRRSRLLPDGGQDLDLSPFAGRLALTIDKARSVDRMHRDRGAAGLWRKAYAELADDTSTGLLAAVTSRAEAQVLRISMIYALLDGSATIRQEHLQAALSLWRYCRQSARLIFGNASGDPLLDRLLALIRETPGISRTELRRRISSNITVADFISTLAKLRDSGAVKVEKIETGTKPAEKWFPASSGESIEFIELSPQQAPQSNPNNSINSINTQAQSGMEEVRI